MAIMVEGMHEDTPPEFLSDLDTLKEKIALTVPDRRIPLFQDYELTAVRRKLESLATPAAA